MKEKSIIISLNHGISIRNILQTDIFSTLKKSGVKIIILTPNGDDPSFQKKYGSENIFFEKLEMDKYSKYFKKWKIQGVLKSIKWFTYNGKYDNPSTVTDWYNKVHKKEKQSRRLIHKITNIFEKISIPILRSSSKMRIFLIWLEEKLFSPSYHDDIFNKYKPQYLLVTSPGFFDFDQYIIREARKHGIKIISTILSWDNTSTRGIGTCFPDHLIAWTDTMSKELIELHDTKPEKIFIGGAVQFDHYFNNGKNYSHTNFLSKFNLSNERKLIFFATKSPTGFPWNPDIIEIIAKAINNNEFFYPCQLLVRLHPIHFRRREGALRFKDYFNKYDAIKKKYNHVSFNIPVIQSESIAFDMPDTELSDVASIFRYSNVMVNMFSTMNIEACIFDLPAINVSFEGESHQDNKRPRDNIKIDEMQVHNQRIIQTGGVRVAYNREELIKYINMYLENPGTDREKRRIIVNEECGPNLGNAGKMIAGHILNLVNYST